MCAKGRAQGLIPSRQHSDNSAEVTRVQRRDRMSKQHTPAKDTRNVSSAQAAVRVGGCSSAKGQMAVLDHERKHARADKLQLPVEMHIKRVHHYVVLYTSLLHHSDSHRASHRHSQATAQHLLTIHIAGAAPNAPDGVFHDTRWQHASISKAPTAAECHTGGTDCHNAVH